MLRILEIQSYRPNKCYPTKYPEVKMRIRCIRTYKCAHNNKVEFKPFI